MSAPTFPNCRLDVCKCNGWEIWRTTAIEFRQEIPTNSEGRSDEDGYLVCPFCHKIEITYLGQLAQCDVCEGYFKGYRKYPKISYTCEACEHEM